MSWNDDGTQPSAVGWSQDDRPDTPVVHDGHCEEDCEDCDNSVLKFVTKNAESELPAISSNEDYPSVRPKIREISAGMDDGLEIWAECGCEVTQGESECHNCNSVDFKKDMDDLAELSDYKMGSSVQQVAEFDAKKKTIEKKVEVAAAIRAVEAKKTAGGMMADAAKSKSKALIDRHVEFVQWCGKHMDDNDVEKQEKQGREFLVQKVLQSKTEEEQEDWTMVLEMFDRSMVDFKEKARAKLADLSDNSAPALKTAKQLAAQVRFNGFLVLFIVIPKEWWAGMNGAKAKMAKVKTQRLYDCTGFAIPPHIDETVQMNPILALEKDKAYTECWIQYENVLNKAMPFLNGPCTSDIVILNGMIDKPMKPGMPAARLGNIKKLAEDAKLDNAILQVCLQMLPHVIYLEFLPDTRDGKGYSEDIALHMDRMKKIEQFCTDHNMFEKRLATLQKAAGGSTKQ